MSPLNAAICTTISYTLWVERYYLKNLFDLEVKVPRRSLRYATHRLMVMHPHTKYNWPIWKDKKSYGPDKLRLEEVEAEEKIRLKQYVSLRSKGRHNKMLWNIAVYSTLANKRHKNLWCHMKLFNIEHKHWTLFRKMHASIPDKIQQEIISKVGDIFIFYHIDLIDMMDFKNSIWQLIPTSLHCMSIVDLTIYISQWKKCYIIIAL
jgi:hypothetical protein